MRKRESIPDPCLMLYINIFFLYDPVSMAVYMSLFFIARRVKMYTLINKKLTFGYSAILELSFVISSDGTV